ncbi:MAG: cytochrome c biogenesis protein CcsA [Acidimicrobiia bacterium]
MIITVAVLAAAVAAADATRRHFAATHDLRSRSRGSAERLLARAGGAGFSWMVFAFVAAATLQLLVLLVAGDFSVHYVWQHSASYQGVLQRMSGLLAGSEGSFLVWSLFAAGVAVWTGRRVRSSVAADRADATFVHAVVSLIVLLLVVVTAASGPFRSFSAAFPTLPVGSVPGEGRGLNPVLTNPWMPPHTLLTFAAYALLGLGFAIALRRLANAAAGRAPRDSGLQLWSARVGRLAWLLLSGALLTGIVWAYEEMTFGWFWSWDPVETATLVVWLLLTAALHADRSEDGGRRQLVTAPLVGALPWVGVVFASFVTRSGLHPSVHAFAGGSAGRMLGLLLVVVLGVTAILAVRAWRATAVEPTRQPWLSWAWWLLLAGSGVIVWGLVYPMLATGAMGRSVELDTGFFVLWGYVLAVGLLFVMGFGMQAAQGRRREAMPMLALFMVATAVAAAVKPVPGMELLSAEGRAGSGAFESFFGGASALMLFPPAAYALVAAVERWWWLRRRESTADARLRHLGSAAMHLGVVAVIVGAALATIFSTSVTVAVDPMTGVGASGGVTVRVLGVESSEHYDGMGRLAEVRESATLEVWRGGRLETTGEASVSTYPERAMGRHAQVMVSRGLAADVQVVYHGSGDMGPQGVPVTVRHIPAVSLLFGGMLLFVGGMGMMMAGSRGGVSRSADRRLGDPVSAHGGGRGS